MEGLGLLYIKVGAFIKMTDPFLCYLTGAYTVPVNGLYLFYMKVGAFINGDSPADENPIGNPYNAEIIIRVDGVDIANSNCFDGRDYIR